MTKTVQMEKGFLHMQQDDIVSRYAYICVSDGTYFAFQGSEGIEVMITDPYHDSSLYRSKKDFIFEHDEKRARHINEHFENEFNTTVDKLAEFLILFKDTLAATQFARTTISDAEVKECADAIFSNPAYHQLDLNTELGKEKLYELQYHEFEKRDESMLIPFSVDEPIQEQLNIVRDIRAKIIKPVVFTNPAAADLFGDWYKGQPGDTIYMASQHYTYFHHKDCVEFANPTMSGKDVTGAQMTYDGFKRCEDDKVWSLIIEDVDFLMPATDKEGRYHLFNRAGNDWFSYWRPFLQKGDVAIVRPGFGYRDPIEIVVDSVNMKDSQLIIDYTHDNEKCWVYFFQIEKVEHA